LAFSHCNEKQLKELANWQAREKDNRKERKLIAS
jgi:hypothetical protein